MTNSGELFIDAQSKRDRLLDRTHSFNKDLVDIKDQIKLLENEIHKQKGGLKIKKDMHMDLVVDETMIANQIQ